MNIDQSMKGRALECTRGIADFLCANQSPHRENNPIAGTYPWGITDIGDEYFAYNWNHAFAAMSLLAAAEAFGEERYKKAAVRVGGWLKTLQVFDPFHPDNYGAIREVTPQTPWSAPRDAISVGWAFLELYRATKDQEYLERAKLFAEWHIAHALDEDGWPYWGVQLEPFFDHEVPIIRNDVQAACQGGSLNFYYQLAKVTGDDKWTGEFYVKMADYFVEKIQLDDGYFATIERATKKPPEVEPQGGLHRANDDLGTLGLLCAYKVTGDKKYLDAIQKFLDAVVADQSEDGLFDHSVAAQPVVLNIMYEVSKHTDLESPADEVVDKAIKRILSSQSEGEINPRMRGGLLEMPGKNEVWSRSSCYAIMVLLKLFGGVENYLCV